QSFSLRAWREQRLTDATVLSDNSMLGRAASAWFQAEDAAALKPATTQADGHGQGADPEQTLVTEKSHIETQLRRELQTLQEQKNYNAAYLVDTAGRIRLA